MRGHIILSHYPAVHPYLIDGSGVQNHPQLVLYLLAQQQRPIGFDTSGSGAGHSAPYSHEHQHRGRKNRPHAVVGDAETGSGSETQDVEGTRKKRVAPGSLDSMNPQRHRHNHARHSQSPDVKLEYLVSERLERSGGYCHEHHSEMDGRQQHKEHRDQVYGHRIVGPYRKVPCAEPACRRDAHSVVYRVKGAHSGHHIKQERGGHHSEINVCEYVNRLVDP